MILIMQANAGKCSFLGNSLFSVLRLIKLWPDAYGSSGIYKRRRLKGESWKKRESRKRAEEYPSACQNLNIAIQWK